MGGERRRVRDETGCAIGLFVDSGNRTTFLAIDTLVADVEEKIRLLNVGIMCFPHARKGIRSSQQSGTVSKRPDTLSVIYVAF